MHLRGGVVRARSLGTVRRSMFLGICFSLIEGNVSVIRAHVDPSNPVTNSFAAHLKIRKRGLQEADQGLDVTYGDIRMFKPACHRIPPIRSDSSLGRAALSGRRTAQE